MSEQKQEFSVKYGPPALELGGLAIWVHERQPFESSGFWESNWLIATVCCTAPGASVWVSGPILHLSDIERWEKRLVELYANPLLNTSLDASQPQLSIYLRGYTTGKIEATVEVSPDLGTQSHRFKLTLDQSYLPGAIRGCRQILEEYPMLGQGGIAGT